jgi:nucleotide-binding universal stress UspA family protein
MSLTSILVHLDSTRSMESRLSLAAGYAAKHGARLRAVYADGAAPPDAGEKSAALFREETARAGIDGEWVDAGPHTGDEDTVEALIHHAHTTDLVVIGQTHPDGGSPGLPRDLPERLILSCGRPVLTVPYTGKFTNFGERVLVGWKDGRESTRAVHDSLPILRRSHRVQLLRVLMARDGGTPAGLPLHLVSFLAGHGIKARPEEILAPDFPLGDLLLNHACEEGSDLLVMGAYSMAPNGRPVLGKTARHILRHMTLPVLMSH